MKIFENVQRMGASYSWTQLAIFILQIATALSCIGYASQMVRQKLEINTEALLGWGASPFFAMIIPWLLGATFVGLAITILRNPHRYAIWAAFGMIAFLTAMKTLSFGAFFGLTPLSRASRYLLPVALLMLIEWDKYKAGQPNAILTVMRLAIAMTFFGHGVKVLFHHDSFLKLINGFEQNIVGFDLFNPAVTSFMLETIGVIDLVAAILILTTRWKFIALYMAGWTFLTATSRVFANGFVAWDDIVIRGSYYGIPLAIICLYYWQSGERVEAKEDNLQLGEHGLKAAYVGSGAGD